MIFDTATAAFAPTPPIHNLSAPECRFQVQAQSRTGTRNTVARTAPATGPFLAAFAAIGRGAVLDTANGPTAIEDLEPGERVMTSSGRAELLTWCGSVTLNPMVMDAPLSMVRVPVDAYGPGRPATDTLFGPGAVQVRRNADVCTRIGAPAYMSPLVDCADDGTMVPINAVAPVEFFQLGFERHCGLMIGGLEIASLLAAQPGLERMSAQMRAAYLSLFPQYLHFETAGRAMGPTLSRDELDTYAA